MSEREPLVYVACRVKGGVVLQLPSPPHSKQPPPKLHIRGPSLCPYKPTTAPTIKGCWVLTPLSFAAWREFARANADHVSLLRGDVFMAETLDQVIKLCHDIKAAADGTEAGQLERLAAE